MKTYRLELCSLPSTRPIIHTKLIKRQVNTLLKRWAGSVDEHTRALAVALLQEPRTNVTITIPQHGVILLREYER